MFLARSVFVPRGQSLQNASGHIHCLVSSGKFRGEAERGDLSMIAR